MFDGVFALIAPHTCATCGVEGSPWCVPCRQAAPVAIERCYRCHRLSPGGRTCEKCRRGSSLYVVRAVTRYEEVPKRLLWRLKFERAKAVAILLAEMMAGSLEVDEGMVVAYVPTATRRVRQRGYDQARLIAQGVSRRTGLPLLSCLVRLGQQQQRSASRRQRLSQMEEAFRVVGTEKVSGKSVLLIDDVITTGATLEAAAAVLKKAGATRVSAVVFAQA